MTRTLMIAGAVLAAVPTGAAAQEGAPESYMRFFGSVHEPVSKRTSGNVPTVLTPEGIEGALVGSDLAGYRESAAALADAGVALDAAIGSQRQEASVGYGVGALIGVRVSPRIGAELEVAYRTHDVEGAVSEDVYDVNADAFAGALTQLRSGALAATPALAEAAADAERELAVTTYMANASYFFPAWGRVAPYASAGLGWASPAGDVSDYGGNVAYQLRAGADLDLGPVLVGLQATYVGAGDFERELAVPDTGGPDDVAGDPLGEAGQATVEYGTAEVGVTLTVPLSRR